jgi:hypothetical protein
LQWSENKRTERRVLRALSWQLKSISGSDKHYFYFWKHAAAAVHPISSGSFLLHVCAAHNAISLFVVINLAAKQLTKPICFLARVSSRFKEQHAAARRRTQKRWPFTSRSINAATTVYLFIMYVCMWRESKREKSHLLSSHSNYFGQFGFRGPLAA